ncbi:threonine synthase [Clostridium saccharobutylicum]|uniref:Threonine synthase n=1 Tax=Clostridium saccharobutylicum DSM 13864 TaxID=1345695 RepID=U5MUB4_CLOSA|nr:threonine synthase [Clostridium saccharobutylicum]AGX44118.1 threonine synthase ThrC [Clostridium saccharobutylicum DSM 13864]AQR91408.1 threonine synthase [Clostridium saccharobutylicum]AQS01312.1 threonine synthase [Clostridium saccharobutylicum]AQS10922.1 threonine synthase [Clostridium saccharobutylicum]AQS15295.1 threonine synthase [Clostridium saccharobutylicum]
MKFRSTRGLEKNVSSANAIINGISKDGGLYVPDEFPKIYDELKNNTNIKYEDLAFKVINEYFTDIDDAELMGAINDAYNDRFDVKVKNNFLELYHGPTCAFKDAALLFLPQVMKRAKKICDVKEDITILTATSGDTGKAALEGFAKVEGFKVVVYYPKNGVSAIQERQMSSQQGDNVKVIGIRGNFDDAQTGVKEIFGDNKFREKLVEKGFVLSSANSINIGRLVPQIVYYFYGYFNLINQGVIKKDELINVVVPTGNFGNILAGYYAKQMGLPIDKFICASNENKVLTDFFETGVYDKKRELVLTESPSMDILVSSNLERLLYEASGRDTEVVSELMKDLNTKGVYEVNEKIRSFVKEFYGNFANTKEVYDAIKEVYERDNYLMDTHTAVAYVVKNKYVKETKDDKPALILSTASPYKFPRSICNALNIDVEGINDFKVLEKLSNETKTEIPSSLSKLETAKVLHDEVWDKSEMRDALLSFLNA